MPYVTNPRETEIKFLRGVGEFRAKLFHNLNIYTINDLLEFYPKSYQSRLIDAKIRDVRVDDFVSIKVNIFSVEEVLTRNGKRQLKAIVTDGDRFIECVWFSYGKWVTRLLKQGEYIWINGQVGEFMGNLQIVQPQIEASKEEDKTIEFWKTREILPVYKLTANLTQNILRTAVYNAFALFHQEIDETLPDYIRDKYRFSDRKTALQKLHFTLTPEMIKPVKDRFIFEDFFYYQLLILKNSKNRERVVKPRSYENKGLLTSRLKNQLPFNLTNAQKKVINEIFLDMMSDKTMNRLLQGDVGAGKTIVTIFAILLAIENGFQTALIAPTEILAEQHYKTIVSLTKDIPELNICLIKGGKSKKKTIDKQKISYGQINLAIGTHALFQKDVIFKNLALVVIDEQHRFGVAQRAELSLRHNNPDLLYLSATPIPRSLAMTIFGDMTVSVINQLPPTRKPVHTILLNHNKKDIAYQNIHQELEKGRQVYIVCPLIEESEKMDLQDAQTVYSQISEKIFPQYVSSLLYGRMKAKEKDEIMQRFVNNEIQILISTTVIEVGIDVPNASIMMIEHAERFGLAQLHQLRGRVGRGLDQSYCYLIAYAMSDIGKERLKTMVKTNDGFIIAEKDLELRGPGDMFGTLQSGLPEFRFANLITDQEWLKLAKNEAHLIIEEDPEFELEKNEIIKTYYQFNVLKKQEIVSF
ncbi:MAG: ATP-dependent DNA helicase RecG [Candidatus Cloacimonetes bacterium]|nr:ATP-dependent DNA helicase RecG [Candidatus Cloacimonadota bacterium]MDD4155242.1 ATP-dependent DNA helicase RecG [Candidatus Cloacimonadota bacterium]